MHGGKASPGGEMNILTLKEAGKLKQGVE